MRLPRHREPEGGCAVGGQQGATLLEMLVAMALFGLVTLTAFVVFDTSYRSLLVGRDFSDEHQNGRLVLEWMTRRIRLTGVATLPGTVPWFTNASSSTVAFLALDSDGDGNVDEHRFCLDTSQGIVLEEVAESPATTSGTCSTGAPITSGGTSVRPLRIVNMSFAYFNGADTQLTSFPGQLAAIRRVRIVLGLDSNRSGLYEAATDLTLTMNAVVRTENW